MPADNANQLVKTSAVPQLAGLLGMALLRHWRFVAPQETERWLAMTAGLLDSYHAAPQAFAYAVRQLGTREGYRHWAARYDHGFNPLIEIEQPIVTDLVAGCDAGRALDAACGTGRISALLAAHGHAVTGIDASETMLGIAKEKVANATFSNGNLTALPVDNEAYDLATCCLALTHCVDLAPPVAELARAVVPGGRIIISDIHPMNVFLGGHAGFAIDKDEFAVVENRYHQMSSYLDAFASCGLSVRHCVEPVFKGDQVDKLTKHLLARDPWTRDELGEHFAAAVRAALVGYPVALIWDLEKASR